MILYHQTFSPSTCDCVIEEQFEHDEVTGLNGEPSLWFFHNVCAKHEPLVKDKQKLTLKNWQDEIEKIVKHHEFLLSKNRERHLNDFEEHPIRKRKREALKDMIKLKATEAHALRIDSELMGERIIVERHLDNHENESMNHLLAGLYSKYALIAQNVYDAIRREQFEIMNNNALDSVMEESKG